MEFLKIGEHFLIHLLHWYLIADTNSSWLSVNRAQNSFVLVLSSDELEWTHQLFDNWLIEAILQVLKSIVLPARVDKIFDQQFYFIANLFSLLGSLSYSLYLIEIEFTSAGPTKLVAITRANTFWSPWSSPRWTEKFILGLGTYIVAWNIIKSLYLIWTLVWSIFFFPLHEFRHLYGFNHLSCLCHDFWTNVCCELSQCIPLGTDWLILYVLKLLRGLDVVRKFIYEIVFKLYKEVCTYLL